MAAMAAFVSYCWGLTLLIGCYLAGEVVVTSLAIPLPGALVGLLFLLSGLLLRRKPPRHLARAAQPLLSHMAVLFVPAVCGVVALWPQIQPYWPSISIAIVLTTALSLALVAWLASRILRTGA